MHPELIGQFARSVETGWLGKVVSVEKENHGDQILCKMVGVDELYRTLKGGDIEAALDESDVQWFVPEDLRFLRLVEPRPFGSRVQDPLIL